MGLMEIFGLRRKGLVDKEKERLKKLIGDRSKEESKGLARLACSDCNGVTWIICTGKDDEWLMCSNCDHSFKVSIEI